MRGKKEENRPSFVYGLFTDQGKLADVARKLKILPGVLRVQEIKGSELHTKINEILSSSIDSNFEGEDLLEDTRELAGIKIFFQYGLGRESKQLIMKYALRLAGKDQLGLGPIVPERINLTPESIRPALPLILSLLFLALVFGINFYYQISKYLYLFEAFQGVKFLAPQFFLIIFLFLFAPISGLIQGLAIGLESIDLSYALFSFFLLAFPLTLFSLKKGEWS